MCAEVTKLYNVLGKYSKACSIEQLIESNSIEDAKERFIVDIQMMQPDIWSQMGRDNILVTEL